MGKHIQQYPVLDTGYGAYWMGAAPNSPSYALFEQELYVYPSESHNGYFDVLNYLGAAGLLCLIGFLLTYIRQALRLFAAIRVQGALYLSLIFQQLIANLSESRWFNALTVEFIIPTLATGSLGRLLLQVQAERRARAASGSLPSCGGAHAR